MSLLSKIADRLVLCPSQHPVDSGDNRRELIRTDNNIEIETWVSSFGDFENTPASQRLIVLKIPGTGGRAERSSIHPAELLTDSKSGSEFAAAETWTLNHRGYGGSTGPASLENFVATLESFHDHIESLYPDETKITVGNSLGCLSALYLASRKRISGMLLRNPPPLKRLISKRLKYNWWNFGAAKWIANKIPDELGAIENAANARCPVLFVTSEKDRLVPVEYQQQIIDVYGGESRQFIMEGADHGDLLPEHQQSDYVAAISELGELLNKFKD